jgi:ribosomal protein S13
MHPCIYLQIPVLFAYNCFIITDSYSFTVYHFIFQLLCEQICEKLNIDEAQCLSTLRDIQNHALDRLRSNQVFKETGIASLRIRVSGDVPRNLTIKIVLTVTTEALIQEVATNIDLPTSR